MSTELIGNIYPYMGITSILYDRETGRLEITLSNGQVVTTDPIKGDTGITPDISIGQVETLPPGSQATATITGTPEEPILSLGIPTGSTGPTGEPGVSPDIEVTEITGGHRLTITDKDGTQTVDVMDGASSTITVTEITGGHRITITDKDGTKTVDVMDGNSPSITVTEITGGHRVTITDQSGTQTVDVMDGARGAKGDTGDDGVSPTVTVTDITGGHRVAITDASGTSTFNVMDGDDGVSPSITVTEITGGHRITITDASGTSTFDVPDGNSVSSVVKTKTEGLVDTYTITMTDGTTFDFLVHNGTASIDPTLTVTDAGADAKVTGDKIRRLESDLDYAIEGILNDGYRERYLGEDFEWEDGGISGTTGNPNTNQYSYRTADFIEFEADRIAILDPDSADYRLAIFWYDKDTGDYVSYTTKTDITTTQFMIDINHAYKYKFVLQDMSQTVRPNADNFVIYDTATQHINALDDLRDDINYAGYAAQDNRYRHRYLGKRFVWNKGGINGSGGITGDAYTIFTDLMSFDDITSIVGYDPNGANERLTFVAYDKTTGAFVDFVYITRIDFEKKVTLNPAYNYRLSLSDISQTARPTGDTLELYEYRDTIEVRKADVKTDTAQPGIFTARKPLVTIIDDDGSVQFYNRYFDANGQYLVDAPMCTAYEGINLGSANFMTLNQLKTLVDAGCEILGHGATPLAPERGASDPITIEQAEQDVIANLQPLLDAGFEVGGYCYPYGSCNVEVREMIAKYYTHAYAGLRSVPAGQTAKWYNDGCIPTYAIARYPLYDGNNELKTWSALEPVIQATVAAKGWLVLYTHTWRDTGVTATPAALNAIIANIEAAGAEVVTAKEAFEMFRNAMEAGDYLGPWNTCSDWTSIDAYETHAAADAGSAVNKLGKTDLQLNLQSAESEGY